MRSQGLTFKDYAPFARADQGVMAAHRWFDAAGYQQMWQQRLAGGSSNSGGGSSTGAAEGGGGARYSQKPYSVPRDESEYLNWYERHTKNCPECMAGMQLLQQVANAAAVAALLLVVAAASFAVAAKTVACPGAAVCALLAAAVVWLRGKVLDFRQITFINSTYRWQRDGGLSLVKGDPIKLY